MLVNYGREGGGEKNKEEEEEEEEEEEQIRDQDSLEK